MTQDAPHFRPVLMPNVCEDCFYYEDVRECCFKYPELSVEGNVAGFYTCEEGLLGNKGGRMSRDDAP